MSMVNKIYRTKMEDGSWHDVNFKRELIDYLLTLSDEQVAKITEIKWYKGGGQWADVTKANLKELAKVKKQKAEEADQMCQQECGVICHGCGECE